MPKKKTGESKKGKNKAERTVSQLTMSPDTEKPAISIIIDSKHEDDETDSIWLVKVLDTIGANDGYRKMRHEAAITFDTLDSFTGEYSIHHVGGSSEGTVTPGAVFDEDVIKCIEELPVIDDLSKADKNKLCFLLVHDPETPAGYVKLQTVVDNVPCKKEHWQRLCFHFPFIEDYCKFDRSGRIVLFDLIGHEFEKKDNPYMTKIKNKPALKISFLKNFHSDSVICYRCKTWPTMANEWLSRCRRNNWPTTETIDELKLLGFFVVRKGHPDSLEIDLEWRISLTLQEQTLIYNLTDIQYKCYVVLKMINRDVLKLDCITSYHWKTCLFYIIEGIDLIVWEKKHLFGCVKLCIKQMLKWVKLNFCPNYFIPAENMFKGRMNDSSRLSSETKLVELLNDGFACLLQVQSDNLSGYVRSQNNLELFKELQAISTKVLQIKEFSQKAETYRAAMYFYSTILVKYAANNNILTFIDFLWTTLYSINKETSAKKRRALSILQDMLYTGLASNISALSIQQLNSPVRDFLLFGCYTFFMRSDLCGRLKFISLLYAAGCYEESKWYLDQEDEKHIIYNPSVCICHNIPSTMHNVDDIFRENSELKMSTCVIFLPTELPITPDALKFEMYRYFGMPSNNREREDFRWRWHYWAVVDSNIYYFFLRFLINRELNRFKSSSDALCDIQEIANLKYRSNIRHLDVYYNVIAWCYRAFGLTPMSLYMSGMSLGIKLSSVSFVFYPKEGLVHKHYQFNSAKIHSLVTLYNIWFTRLPYGYKFCFQCFYVKLCKKNLLKCSGCKTAQYCSKKCQKLNWAIHQTVCKIVRNYLHV